MLYEARKTISRAVTATDTHFVVPSFPNQPNLNPVLLMHFNGVQNSQVFLDATGRHSATATGANAFIDTTQSKFGGSSLRVGAAGSLDYITLDGNSDMASGNKDMTVDFWAMRNSQQASIMYSTGLIDVGDPGSMQIYWFSDNIIYVSVGAVDAAINGPTVNDTLVWHHFAVTRKDSIMRLFVDGIQYGINYLSTQTLTIAANSPAIGNKVGGSLHFDGWIDEMRVLNSVAAWNTSFTPPAVPYMVS